MKLKNQKRIASQILKASPKRVKLDPKKFTEIKEAITKSDVKGLIRNDIITLNPKKGVSRVRARKIIVQKRKGRRSGQGSRKGKKTARLSSKRLWINKIRIQREFLKDLANSKLLTTRNYRELYLKIKGGYFRSKAHLKLYINENNLIKENGKK